MDHAILRCVLARLIFVALVLIAGCAPPLAPLETDADAIGFVTEIRPHRLGREPRQIVVESHADKLVTRYVVTVTSETRFFRREGDDLRRASFRTLERQHWVRLWVAEPTTGTFPITGTAAQIVILGFESP